MQEIELINQLDQNEPAQYNDDIDLALGTETDRNSILSKDSNSAFKTIPRIDLVYQGKKPEPTLLPLLISKPVDELIIFQDEFGHRKSTDSFIISENGINKVNKDTTKPYFNKIRNKTYKFAGLRVISDTILTKRNFSSDNEQYTKEKAKKANNYQIKQLSDKKKYNISLNYFGKKPLIRNALATISHINWLEPKSLSKDVTEPERLSIPQRMNVIPENKENAPVIITEEQATKTGTTSATGESILLFTPQHYWNIVFQHQKKNSSILLEDYHMLLYDYETLWNHVQQQNN